MDKRIKTAIIGFLIGIPCLVLIPIVFFPLFIFLSLGTPNGENSSALLVNLIISLITLSPPFVGAAIGWYLASKKLKKQGIQNIK